METDFSKSQGIIKALPSLDSTSLTQLIRSQGKYTHILEIKMGIRHHANGSLILNININKL